MSKKEKKVKPYGATSLLKDFVIISLVVIYITVMIGDGVSVVIDDSMRIFTRHIPIAVVTLISTFFIMKSCSKKCNKAEEEAVKKNLFIAPIIIAIIFVLYGFYSVSSNMTEIKQENSWMFSLYEEEFEKAASEARVGWIIASVVYFVAAEFVVFMNKKNLNKWLQDVPEVMMNTEGLSNEVLTNETFEVKKKEETQPINNIKWDL